MSTELWYDLSEEDYNETLRLTIKYRDEATKCLKGKAYIAGCTAAGASLEAALLSMVHIYGEEVDSAGHAAKYKGSPKPLLKWKFVELQRAAESMGWLPRGLQDGDEWNEKKAKIGDYAVALRQFRNLIHPARYIQDHRSEKVTRKNLKVSTEILEVALQVLNNEVIRKLNIHFDSQKE